MKLYYSPMTCSLAGHIALEEAGVDFERELVNLSTKPTAAGLPLASVSIKGHVPVLQLDDGDVLTENVAILDWIATRFPKLGVSGDLGRTRLIEALAYISTELHPAFKALLHARDDQETVGAKGAIRLHLEFMSECLKGEYLFGEEPSVADCYLFVVLLWAERFNIDVPARLFSFREQMKFRSAVRAVLIIEGLL
jgi:glutathione S-transferase